jgi:hypothetical protein
MSPEQRTVYEQIEHDLRMALKSLSEPYMDEVAHTPEVRELARIAHDLVESVLLDGITGRHQADRSPKKIA